MALSLNLAHCCTFHDLMWTSLMVDGVDDDHGARMVTIAWTLWHNRNEVRHGGERKKGQALVQWALGYIAEYRAAIDAACVPPTVPEQVYVWRPPKPRWFKVNFDGVIFVAQKAVGIGMIIKDEKNE